MRKAASSRHALRDSIADFCADLLCRALLAFRPRLALPGSLAQAKSILVIKLDALGDAVLLTPFLRELRHAAPSARITLIHLAAARPILASHPHADVTAELVPDPAPRRLGTLRAILRLRRFLDRASPGQAFDAAIIPRRGTDFHHARLLALLSGAKYRLAFALDQPIVPSSAAPTLTLECEETPLPEAEANLALLQKAGIQPRSTALEVDCPAAELRDLEARLARAGIDSRTRLVAFGVGAAMPHRIWPAARFLELARHLTARENMRAVCLGDKSDALRFSMEVENFFNWAGLLTAAQSVALLRTAALFVGNDSGALHLAAAAGCPTVAIYSVPLSAPASIFETEKRFLPYRVPSRVVRPPDGDARDVTVESVIEAAGELLSIPPARPA